MLNTNPTPILTPTLKNFKFYDQTTIVFSHVCMIEVHIGKKMANEFVRFLIKNVK